MSKRAEVCEAVQRTLGDKVYLIGGAVRDAQLGIEANDYDFATPYSVELVERLVRADKRKPYLMGKRFGTIGFKAGGELVEVTTFRTETYKAGCRKPTVEFTDNLHADLARRDFTFNAMAMKPNGKLIDPHGGMGDLTRGIIRTVGAPTTRFKEDPLRMLRAARFAAQFGFQVEQDTLKAMRKNAYRILDVSRERWTAELDKLLTGHSASHGLSVLAESGLLGFILPELVGQVGYDQNSRFHALTLWEHTLAVVDGVPNEVELRWAALLHDVGKPAVRTLNLNSGRFNYVHHERVGADMVEGLAAKLNWSNARRDAVAKLVRNHMRDDSPLKAADDAAKLNAA